MEETLQILIVDDDAVDRQAVRHTLLSSDLSVEIAEAGQASEVSARLAETSFDVVLLSFGLSDADGLTMLRELRERGFASPIIVVSGHDGEGIAVEAMKAGAADYIPKARLSPEALARSLRHLLRVRRAEAIADQGQFEMEAVLTSMTEGLIVSDLAGQVLTMNPAALRLFEFGSVDEVRRPRHEFPALLDLQTAEGRSLPLEEWPLARALRGETFSHLEARVHRRDTGTTWVGSFGGTLARGKTGESLLALVTVRDTTQLKRAQERAAFLAEAGVRLSASLDAQTILETVARLAVPRLADWCAVHVLDEAGKAQTGIVAHADPEEEAKMRAMPAFPRTWATQFLPVVPEAEAVFGTRSYLCVPLRARDRMLGSLSLGSTRIERVYDQEDLALAQELGRRVSVALDNARLFEEVQARAERESLINKIGQALRVTLDVDEILQIVTEQVGLALAVSRCRWASLNAARDAFEIAPEQYAAAGVSSAPSEFPLMDCSPEMLEEWTAGRPVVVSDTSLGEHPPQSEGLLLTRAFISCPVFLRSQFSGLFTVHQTDRSREWTADEVAFLTSITDILALALENARLFTREHRVADMLSSAFLTDIPDTLPGLALASSYRAGLEEARVGGDYYDAFSLPDGRVALVIGDVSGKGLNAAVQTATVKYSLRAFATEAGSPGLVLTRLNRMLCSASSGLGDHFVPLFYALFEPATGRLTYASAGHESIIIKRAVDGADLLGATGPILGIAEHGYDQAEGVLGIGDSLILYTDGLTEARATGTREMLDLERVLDLVRTAPSEAGPGALSARLQQAALFWTGGRPQDDMALLVARRLRQEEGSKPTPVSHSTPGRQTMSWRDESGDLGNLEETLFDFQFPCRADFAAEARQVLGHWMPALGFPREAIEDMQTAVTEAVTNAVRHGSPLRAAAQFRVSGHRASDGAFRVEVTDTGPGQPPGTFPAMPGPEAVGGRGLPLMRELTDRVEFHSTPTGHCVTLLKRPPERRRK